jgi:hypothetical protein
VQARASRGLFAGSAGLACERFLLGPKAATAKQAGDVAARTMTADDFWSPGGDANTRSYNRLTQASGPGRAPFPCCHTSVLRSL